MAPKSFLTAAHTNVDDVASNFDDLSLSDSSPPELVAPESLEESSKSGEEGTPTTEVQDPGRVGIIVSTSSHSSRKEICLQEIKEVAASHGFTMTVFSPVSSRPNSPLPACESRSNSPTLPGCPHDASHHVRCHDSKGSYCVVRKSGGAPSKSSRAMVYANPASRVVDTGDFVIKSVKARAEEGKYIERPINPAP